MHVPVAATEQTRTLQRRPKCVKEIAPHSSDTKSAQVLPLSPLVRQRWPVSVLLFVPGQHQGSDMPPKWQLTPVEHQQ